MPTSRPAMEVPDALSLTLSEHALTVDLADGRTISAPLAWFPRLFYATPEERARWRFVGRGQGIHWDALDEDISVEGLLAGWPSGESQASLKKWLEGRTSLADNSRP